MPIVVGVILLCAIAILSCTRRPPATPAEVLGLPAAGSGPTPDRAAASVEASPVAPVTATVPPESPITSSTLATRTTGEPMEVFVGCPPVTGGPASAECIAVLQARDDLADRLGIPVATIRHVRHEHLSSTETPHELQVVLQANGETFRYRAIDSPVTGLIIVQEAQAITPTLAPRIVTLPDDVSAAVESLTDLLDKPRPTSDPSFVSEATERFATLLRVFVSYPEAADSRMREALQKALTIDPSHPASVLAVEVSDGRQPAIVASLGLGGIPILVAQPTATDASIAELPPGRPDTSSVAHVDRIVNLTGDQQPAIVATWTTQGATSSPVRILIVGWSDDGFLLLFDRTISNWAGHASWQITPQNQIVVSCPAFGYYDQKLLAHPTQQHVYAWDGTRFILEQQLTESPKYPRWTINLAEAALFRGDLITAALYYRSVADSRPVNEPGVDVDWRAYAAFRLGQIAALRGNRDQALTRFHQAEAAAEPLASLARAFRLAYESGGPAAGFGAIQRSDFPQRLYQGNLGNLAGPVDAAVFGALGWGLAALIGPTAVDDLPTAEDLAARARRAGLAVVDLTVADLEGDDEPEVAAILPFGSQESRLWLLRRAPTSSEAASMPGWVPHLAIEGVQQIVGVAAAPDGNSALQVRLAAGTGESEMLIGLDGRSVISYQGSTATRLDPHPFAGQCIVGDHP